MRIQLEPGQSSSATHDLAQPSTPSRLINLHVHSADLATPVAPSEPTAFYLEADNSAPSVPETPHAFESVPAAYPEQPVAEPDMSNLALNIAADYTAATFGAVSNTAADAGTTDALSAAIRDQQNSDSIDEIARTASESIAAIRAATDPSDVAEQISALEKFAEQIKSDSSLPEISELSETIEKFVKIASKSTGVQEELTKKRLLSAKANRAATKVTKSSAKVATIHTSAGTTKTVLGHSANIARPMSKSATRATSASLRRKSSTSSAHRVVHPARAGRSSSARDDDFSLQEALNSVVDFNDEEYPEKTRRRRIHRRGNAKRFALALGCAAACVAAIIYFVGSNIPDLSVRVAAMQTGVDASYPSYIPQGYSLDEINSENGKITLSFSNTDGKSFSIIGEKSSWDSSALLRNFVEPTWGSSYTTTHEQGITIFLYGSSAAWVNGGVFYKIDCATNILSKKQLRNIVTSMQ